MARGRHTALTIQLTPDARRTLEQWQHSKTLSARRARRGRMLLLLAAQVPVSHVAVLVGCTRHHVYKWAQRFLAEGLAGLADKRKPRRAVPEAPPKTRRARRNAVPQVPC